MKFSSTICQLLFMLVGAQLMAQGPNVLCPGTSINYNGNSANDDKFWNANYYWDPLISKHDLGEAETDLHITTQANCGSAQDLTFRYLLYLDLNYDGVLETFLDSDSLPYFNNIHVGNKPSNLFSGTIRNFDFRQVTPALQWGFNISVQTSSDTVTAHVVWENQAGQVTTPKMPYGNHHIKWIIRDGCGNESVCDYNFSVSDTGKPEVVCVNDVTINIMNTSPPATYVWASDFLQSTVDNYTPSDQIKIGIREKGTGTGFPFNNMGTPQVGIGFNCGDIGNHIVELWSIDKNGNADYCEVLVTVADNLWSCEVPISFQGQIVTPQGIGIEDVSIEVNVADPTVSSPIFFDALTNQSGYFWEPYRWPPSASATMTPILNLDYLNGLSTWDLVLISRHILGIEPLDSPYKLISADANKSGTITTFDVIEFRRLMLGTYTELPNNNSWRFVDKDQVFFDPANPFADTIRETLPFVDIFASPFYDFIGCKIGDVDYSAIPHFQGEPENRNLPLRAIKLKDQWLKAGETVDIHFEIPEELIATQLTMSGTGIRLENLDPGYHSPDHFAIFANESNEQFQPLFTAVLEDDNTGFDVQFTALKNGYLHEMLSLSDEITPPKGFDGSGTQYDLTLAFESKNEVENNPVLFPGTPNPWHDFTQITFRLPDPATVTHLITDQHGRPVLMKKVSYSDGYQHIIFNREDFPGAGIYYYQLITDQSVGTQKLILLY